MPSYPFYGVTVLFIFPINLGVRGLSSSPALHSSNFYTVTYEIGETGEKHTVQVNIDQSGRTMNMLEEISVLEFQAKEGDNLLDIAINNDIDLDGFGACEGTLACSTCHVVFTPVCIPRHQAFPNLMLPGGFCKDR